MTSLLKLTLTLCERIISSKKNLLIDQELKCKIVLVFKVRWLCKSKLCAFECSDFSKIWWYFKTFGTISKSTITLLSSLRMRTLVGKHADLLKILDGFWRHISKSEIRVTFVHNLWNTRYARISVILFQSILLTGWKRLGWKGNFGIILCNRNAHTACYSSLHVF